MNPNNYGSLPACKKLAEVLVKKGRVIETEFYWCRDESGWYFRCEGTYEREVLESIPAPSMAEVFRGLPGGTMMEKQEEDYLCWRFLATTTRNTNPTDALINLLIWIKQEEGKG